MNFWNIELSELPSRGLLYPSNTEIKIRPLSIGDTKYLSTINFDDARISTKMLNEILRNCIKLNIPFEELAMPDRTWLLFWIRVNSFVTSNGYDVKIQCPNCKMEVVERIRLDELGIRYVDPKILDALPRKILFNGEELDVLPRVPRIKDKLYTSDDAEISDILNYTDFGKYVDDDTDADWFVNRLEAAEYAKLKTIAKEAKFGFNGLVSIQCKSCDTKLNIQLDLRDTNVFSKITLYDIVRTQIQVSKYCGFMISDDTTVTEVELIQEVIRKMIEEEKAAQEEQQRNVTSLSRRPNIKMPNFHR